MIDTFTLILLIIAAAFAITFAKILYDIKRMEKEDIDFLKREIDVEEQRMHEMEKKIIILDRKMNEKASVVMVKNKLEEIHDKIKKKN